MAQADAREALRQAIASEHRLFLEAENHDRLAARWRSRAELALRCGEDGLAREALARSAVEERLAADYRAQCLAQADVIRRGKGNVQAVLPTAVASAERRLNQLALDDRLEHDLQALKRRLATPPSGPTVS